MRCCYREARYEVVCDIQIQYDRFDRVNIYKYSMKSSRKQGLRLHIIMRRNFMQRFLTFLMQQFGTKTTPHTHTHIYTISLLPQL